MGDMGDYYRDVRAASREKRAENRNNAPQLLRNEGILFTSHNHGAHLIVAGCADFWPGTGKWIIRGGAKGRGVRSLVNALADQQ